MYIIRVAYQHCRMCLLRLNSWQSSRSRHGVPTWSSNNSQLFQASIFTVILTFALWQSAAKEVTESLEGAMKRRSIRTLATCGFDAPGSLGCSAVPVLVSQNFYTLRKDLETLRRPEYSSWRPDAQLGNNGTDYNHAFAILRLKANGIATAQYYEVPAGGAAKLLCSE